MSTDTSAAIRRYKKNIEISGIALFIIGVWSVLKFLITVMMGSQSLQDVLQVSDAEMEKYRGVYIVALMIMFALFMLLYLYIARSAIYYANGKKKKKTFMYFAAVLGILSLIGIPFYFVSEDVLKNIDMIIASIMVALSTCFLIFDMLYSSVMMKKLKKIEEGN